MNMCLDAVSGVGGIAALAIPVQASDLNTISTGLSTNQYLQIMIAALILVGVFTIGAYFIGKKNARRNKVNQVTKILGMIIAIISLIVGTFLLLIDFIVLIEPYVQTNAFTYTALTFQYYFPEMVFGIIIVGATGLLLYLIGFHILVFVHESSLIEKGGVLYRIQTSSEVDTDVSKGKVKYSTIAFTVTSWETKEPLTDGKIRLETKDGTLIMIKYTDYTGDVDFGKLRGTEDDYYAYVEGDRERQEYRFFPLT